MIMVDSSPSIIPIVGGKPFGIFLFSSWVTKRSKSVEGGGCSDAPNMCKRNRCCRKSSKTCIMFSKHAGVRVWNEAEVLAIFEALRIFLASI